MKAFNKVIFQDHSTIEGVIALVVHPFYLPHIVLMNQPNDYTRYQDDPLSESQKRMADALWEELPGLDHIFFKNGAITIVHKKVFPNVTILEAAESIIEPELKAELKLRQLLS